MSKGLGWLERKILEVLPKISHTQNVYNYGRYKRLFETKTTHFGATVLELTFEIFGGRDKNHHCSLSRAVRRLRDKGKVNLYCVALGGYGEWDNHKEIFVEGK